MSTPDFSYPRDTKGYAGRPPDPRWPGGARVAVSLVINLETGAELSLADGDERNEAVFDIVYPVEGVPNYCLSSHFDYGTRAGYWRVARLLEEFGAPCTVSSAGRAVEKSPHVVRDAVARGWEVSAHGYRWEGHSQMDEAHEREVIAKTVRIITEAAGERPVGWHSKGDTSPHTRRLLVEAGFLYDSDEYNDDLPSVVEVAGQPHVVIPYCFDANDMNYMAYGKFFTAVHFGQYCIDAFDTLWEEGEHHPAMMSVGIHPHYLGRPGRIKGLRMFLDHVAEKGGAWIARRKEIAHHWRQVMGLSAFNEK